MTRSDEIQLLTILRRTYQDIQSVSITQQNVEHVYSDRFGDVSPTGIEVKGEFQTGVVDVHVEFTCTSSLDFRVTKENVELKEFLERLIETFEKMNKNVKRV